MLRLLNCISQKDLNKKNIDGKKEIISSYMIQYDRLTDRLTGILLFLSTLLFASKYFH